MLILVLVAGILLGLLLSFGARLADKDITRIVERYGRSGSVLPSKPIIIHPPQAESVEERIKRETDEMNEV